MNEKAIELFGNEEFLEKIENMESLEEVKSAFAENGVDLDVDAMKELVTQNSEELSEDKLDDVSGGIIGAIALGWGIGKAIGIVGRTIYEDATGKKRTYSMKNILKSVGLF